MYSLPHKKFYELENSSVMIFETPCESGLVIMRFSFLEHLGAGLANFPNILFLDASSCIHFIDFLKRSYRKTSIKRATRMKETSGTMNSTLKSLNGNNQGANAFCII